METLFNKPHRGARFKDLRQRAGMSLNALSSLVMVDPSTISRWESRREFIHVARFLQALYALGTTPEEFLGLKPEELCTPPMEEIAA